MDVHTFGTTVDWLKDNLRATVPADLLALAVRMPRTSAADALGTLQKLARLSEQPCADAIKMDVGDAIVSKADPVDVLFRHLPTPEEHEKRHLIRDIRPVSRAYQHAAEVFKCLAVIHGEDSMKAKRQQDPILNFLFKVIIEKGRRSFDLFRNLLVLALYARAGAFQGTTDPGRYNLHTQRTLEYLDWVFRGRKDITCKVVKPWRSQDNDLLRRTPTEDLSRLPPVPELQEPPGAEVEELHRRSQLFQVAFEQYLLSANDKAKYFAFLAHGIVQVKHHDVPAPTQFEYLGQSPDLDLKRPAVRSALHAFKCADIKHSARLLFELFFLGSCASIQFVNVALKNAKTVVMVHKKGTKLSNMAPAHTIAVLTTNSGRKFVLDPTAAQYGWVENFAPFEAYDRYRIDRVLLSEVCGPPARPSTPTEHTPKPESEPARHIWTAMCVAEDVRELMEVQFMENGGIGGLLGLQPQAEFENFCVRLRNDLREEMREVDRRRA